MAVFTLTTVPGYVSMPDCPQTALSYALDPSQSIFTDCQPLNALPSNLASCICLTETAIVASYLSEYSSVGCSSVFAFTSAYDVFNNFCSVNAGKLSAVTPTLTQASFVLTTVQGYTAMPDCPQTALSAALDPNQNSYANCQTDDPANVLASCICDNEYEYSQITAYLQQWSSIDCSSEVAFSSAYDVFNNFCSVNAGEMKPVAAVTTIPGFTAPATSESSAATASSPSSTAMQTSTYITPVFGLSSASVITPLSTSSASGQASNSASGSGASGGGLDRASEIATIVGTIFGFIAIVVAVWAAFFRPRGYKKLGLSGETGRSQIKSTNNGGNHQYGRSNINLGTWR